MQIWENVEYQKFIKSRRWKDFRDLYFRNHLKVCRARNRKCQGYIELHHLEYKPLNQVLQFRDFLPLCHWHHRDLTLKWRGSRKDVSLRVYSHQYIVQEKRR